MSRFKLNIAQRSLFVVYRESNSHIKEICLAIETQVNTEKNETTGQLGTKYHILLYIYINGQIKNNPPFQKNLKTKHGSQHSTHIAQGTKRSSVEYTTDELSDILTAWDFFFLKRPSKLPSSIFRPISIFCREKANIFFNFTFRLYLTSVLNNSKKKNQHHLEDGCIRAWKH